MDMFPHVVTLYSIETGTDQSTMDDVLINHITVLDGVLLDATKAQNVNESGLENADAVTLFIPINVKATDGETGKVKTFIGPIDYWKAEDKSELWTLSTGQNTFFVKGRHVHPDWTTQKIDAAYDDVYDITKVDFFDYGGDMSHWEVGGN